MQSNLKLWLSLSVMAFISAGCFAQAQSDASAPSTDGAAAQTSPEKKTAASPHRFGQRIANRLSKMKERFHKKAATSSGTAKSTDGAFTTK